jgi:fatty-acyl-CoA synthase
MLHADWLSRRAIAHPERAAIVDVDRGRTTTYAELSAGAWRAAAVLKESFGVQPGDRVAVHARNRVEQVEIFFACARLSALLVPLNWRLAAPELADIVADASPRLLICDDDGADALAALPPSICEAPVVRFDRDAQLPAWSTLCARIAALPLVAADTDEDTPLLVLYTSGSTGRPKGALLTHGTLGWNAINTVVGWGLQPSDCTLTAAPLFHTGGWNVFTLPLLYCGGTVSMTAAFDPGQTLAAVASGHATVLFGVPTMFQAMREHPSFARADLSSLRFAISGGAPCPAPLNQAWLDRGVEFKQGYGLTEVGPNCFSLPDGGGANHPGSVGVPVPHLRTRVVDGTGRQVAPGEVGELQLQGPTVCAGYWQRPEATAAAITDDGWFRTGDLFSVDPSGWYRCVGRKKEMFISGGENVYPAEVERVLCGIDGVAEAAVVPVGHPRWGEVGHAFLAFRGAEGLPEDAIRALCRGQLAGYKVPRRVSVLEALPTGPTGKIDKRALRDLAGAAL